MELVKATNLVKLYSGIPALSGVSFTVPKGQIVGLLGPNGCGKTTTLKILAGLINDYKGEVLINGQPPSPYTKSIVSYLPDKTYLSDWMKPKNAIEFFADFYDDFDKNKAYDMLARFALSPKQTIKTMSKGMQDKVLITLALSRKAELYLLDEPMGGVDPAARADILNTILSNYAESASLLISTHMIYDVEDVFDHVIIMGRGSVITSDSSANIKAQSGTTIDEYFRGLFKWQ